MVKDPVNSIVDTIPEGLPLGYRVINNFDGKLYESTDEGLVVDRSEHGDMAVCLNDYKKSPDIMVYTNALNVSVINTPFFEISNTNKNVAVVSWGEKIMVGRTDGLSSSVITIYKDGSSKMFNGHPLSSSAIKCMVVDSLNNLIIATDKGIVKCDSDTFLNYTYYRSDNGSMPINGADIAYSLSNTLYIVKNKVGLEKFGVAMLRGGKWTDMTSKFVGEIFPDPFVPVEFLINSITSDQNGDLWLGCSSDVTETNLIKYSVTENRFSYEGFAVNIADIKAKGFDLWIVPADSSKGMYSMNIHDRIVRKHMDGEDVYLSAIDYEGSVFAFILRYGSTLLKVKHQSSSDFEESEFMNNLSEFVSEVSMTANCFSSQDIGRVMVSEDQIFVLSNRDGWILHGNAEGHEFIKAVISATEVEIEHKLSKRPNVVIIDEEGADVECDINYINSKKLSLAFNPEFTGIIYCN